MKAYVIGMSSCKFCENSTSDGIIMLGEIKNKNLRSDSNSEINCDLPTSVTSSSSLWRIKYASFGTHKPPLYYNRYFVSSHTWPAACGLRATFWPPLAEIKHFLQILHLKRIISSKKPGLRKETETRNETKRKQKPKRRNRIPPKNVFEGSLRLPLGQIRHRTPPSSQV